MKVDHQMAIVQYVKVKAVHGRPNGSDITLELRDQDTGLEWQRSGTTLVQRMLSSDLFEEERKVTRTELDHLLAESFNRPLTVCWVTEGAGDDAIRAGKKRMEGEQRVLRGRYVKAGELGRHSCEDLDLPLATRHGERFRLVDSRTIVYLIVDGVKYTPK